MQSHGEYFDKVDKEFISLNPYENILTLFLKKKYQKGFWQASLRSQTSPIVVGPPLATHRFQQRATAEQTLQKLVRLIVTSQH